MKLPKAYTYGEVVSIEESLTVEYKEVKGSNPVSSIQNTADNYAVGFLNSQGGIIYWGISDDRKILGIELTAQQRDKIRRAIVNKLNDIQPHLDPSRFRTEFIPVLSEDSITGERFVVALKVPKGDQHKLYFTGGGEVYVRTDAVNQKLNGSQINERIVKIALRNPSPILSPELKLHVQRVRQVFTAHGILETQWARFFEIRKASFTITLRDLRSDDALLEWIDETKLEWIADTFLLRSEWLEGEDEIPHHQFHFDKNPVHFFETISRYVDDLIREDVPAYPEAYFIRWGMDEDWPKKGQSRIFVIVRIPLARLSDESYIWRYISDFEPYPWNYERTNIQLRAWARLLSVCKKMFCYGCVIDYKAGQDILNGHFLEDRVQKCMTHVWDPEDHALYSDESKYATDTDTLPDVIHFLKEHGLPYEETRL